MPTLPPGRPPPSSVLSFKRDALEGIASEPPGWLEAELIPSLFERGLMVADERVVADHFQDHGCWWSVYNGFDSARSSYGFKRSVLTPAQRREVARWALSRASRARCDRSCATSRTLGPGRRRRGGADRR